MNGHVNLSWVFGAAWAVITMAFLSGCETLRQPQGFDQRLAYAYGSYTAVVNSAAHGVEVGSLSLEDGEAALATARNARQFLDAAHNAWRLGEVAEADDKLILALAVLSELQRYLERRGL
jgi:hypothetical protein